MQTAISARTSRYALLPVAVGLLLVVMCIASSAASGKDVVSSELVQHDQGEEPKGPVPTESRCIIRLLVGEEQLDEVRGLFPSVGGPGPFETTVPTDSLGFLRESGIDFAVAGTQVTGRDVGTPELLSPPDFEGCVSTTVVLSWTEVSGPYPITYQLRIGDYCGSGSTFTTSATSLQVSGLDYHASYAWQVQAGDIFGWGSWSDCFCFQTIPDPNAVADLQLPEDQAQGVPTSVTLDWSTVPGEQSYDVQMGTSCGTGSIYEASESEYAVTGLESGTTYHWRVRAHPGCGITGDWTDCFSFETVVAAPDPEFVLNPSPPAEAIVGDPLTLLMSVVNNGGASEDGSISVSFPELTDPDDCQHVSFLEGTSSDDGTVPTCYAHGEPIHDSGGAWMDAEYVLAEYADFDWQGGETNTLELAVAPQMCGDFHIYVRSAMGVGGVYVNDVPLTGEGGFVDQQGWPVKRYTVAVQGGGSLAQGYVTPEEGDAGEEFVYFVEYDHPSGMGPASCMVYIDGTPHEMTDIPGLEWWHRYSTTLSPSNHDFRFEAQDFQGCVYASPSDGAYDGPSVEPDVVLNLALASEDAPPDVTVFKGAGDMVDFVATIVNHDGQTHSGIEFALSLPGDELGDPLLTYRRWHEGEGDGDPLVWWEPSTGTYRVELGADLPPGGSVQVGWRFRIPASQSPGAIECSCSLYDGAVEVATANAEVDVAASVDGLIVVNRTALYDTYGQTSEAHEEVTELLADLYSFSDGSGDGEITNVVYYLDRESDVVRTWDQNSIDYSVPESVNTVAEAADDLIETLSGRFDDGLIYLTIVGGDETVPFFRIDDAEYADVEGDNALSLWTNDPVLSALYYNRFLSDAPYGDLTGDDWDEGQIELAVGRLVGMTAEAMDCLLQRGVSRPGTESTYAVVAGKGGYDMHLPAGRALHRGFDVRNDTESPMTVNVDPWTADDLKALMELSARWMGVGSHASYDRIADLRSYQFPPLSNAPFFTTGGCRSGVVTDESSSWDPSTEDNNAWAAVARGASAFMGSGGLVEGITLNFFTGWGERFYNEYFGNLIPYEEGSSESESIGLALRATARGYDPWTAAGRKAVSEFMIYGVPWMTIDIPESPPGARTAGARPSSEAILRTSTKRTGRDQYETEVVVVAGSYEVQSIEEYDVLIVPGAVQHCVAGRPVLPVVEASLLLPPDALIQVVTVEGAHLTDLGALPLPAAEPVLTGLGEPPTETGFGSSFLVSGVYPDERTHGIQVAENGRIRYELSVFPATFEVETQQVTLYDTTRVTISFTSAAPVSVGSAEFIGAWSDSIVTIGVEATLVNVSDSDASGLLSRLEVFDSSSGLIGIDEEAAIIAEAGSSYMTSLSHAAMLDAGRYTCRFTLLNAGGTTLVELNEAVWVTPGELLDGTSSGMVLQGDDIAFSASFRNAGTELMTARAVVLVYDGAGGKVAEFSGDATPVPPGQTVQLAAEWSTVGRPIGPYQVLLFVQVSGGVRFGPLSIPFLVTQGPELGVRSGDIGFTPASPASGDDVSVSATVENYGLLEASQVAVELWDVTDTTAVYLGSDTIESIPAGADSSASFTWSTTGVYGDRLIEVRVDPSNLIPEGVESDNSAVASVFLSGTAPVPAPWLFVAGQNFAVGDRPYEAAIADLDGDGVKDMAVAIGSSDDVSILLGNGDGTFQAAASYVAGDEPRSVAIADLDGDGDGDLAVANDYSGNVSVLLGNGDGTFQTAVGYGAGTGSYCVAIADLDGDGNEDLALANIDSDDVSVLLGNGDGTFRTAVSYGAGDYPSSVAIADLDGDGDTDLTLANYLSGNVSVLLGNGDGTFQTAVGYGAGSYPRSVAVADLDGDGDTDLAVAHASSTVSILLGNGDGTFQTAVGYGAGTGSYCVAIADLDGDGNEDLALANTGSDDVSVLLGNGDGTFQTAVDYGTGSYPRSVAIADLDGDGAGDLVVTNNYSDNVSVLLGNGDGTLRTSVNYAAGDYPSSVAIADFDGDGDGDLATANSQSDNVTVLLSNSDGTFQAAVECAAGVGPRSLVAADLDGDGEDDLAVASFGSDDVSVLLGNGDGTFQTAVGYGAGDSPISVAIADLDGDGNEDIVTANYESDNISILLGNGDGTFQMAVDHATAGTPRFVAAADFDGDGNVDLAVAVSSKMSIFLGNGDGTFQTPVVYNSGYSAGAVAIADLDGDGNEDLAVTNYATAKVSILLGNGDGTFQTAAGYGAGVHADHAAIADLDGDGVEDIAVANRTSYNVSVLLGNGDGTFRSPMSYCTNGSSVFVAIADLDGDGDRDLVVANGTSDNVSVLLNATCTGPSTAVPEAPDDGSLILSGRPALFQNVPNPFNPVTTISFKTPVGTSAAELTLYNVRGAVVRSWLWRSPSSGVHNVKWDSTNSRGRRVGSGVYFCRLTVDNWTATRKIVLLK